MAKLPSEMVITKELRPCIVKDKKALFHVWSDKSDIISPSMMIGGGMGGARKYTVGIIEFENGVVTECWPYEITFVDSKLSEYCFGERETTT